MIPTPEDKANELIDKFHPYVRWKMGQEGVLERAKQCAMLLCKEVLDNSNSDRTREYWYQVLQEIEKL